jgi:pilus assembly protein CpaE
MSSSAKSPEQLQAAGSWSSMNSISSKPPDALGSNVLSVALIGPGEGRRKSIATALATLQGSTTREFAFYPEMDDVARLLEAEYDVIIVELDNNPEYALELVENICGNSSVTVMVYSETGVPGDAGAVHACGSARVSDQPITASYDRRSDGAGVCAPAGSPLSEEADGKLLVFVGAKGGSGVTTVASNFAVALAQESGHRTCADRPESSLSEMRRSTWD